MDLVHVYIVLTTTLIVGGSDEIFEAASRLVRP
jgi:hypothetical protein